MSKLNDFRTKIESKFNIKLKTIGINAVIILVVACLISNMTSNYNSSYSSSYDSYSNYSSDESINSVPGLAIAADSSSKSNSLFGFSSNSTSKTESPTAYDSVNVGLASFDGGSVSSIEADMVYADTEASDNLSKTLSDEKLVYRARFKMETKEYDSAIDSLDNLLEKYGGITEERTYSDDAPQWVISDYQNGYISDTNGWRELNTTIRVPSKNFEDFNAELSEIGHLTSSNSYVENISSAYYDTAIKLESYQEQAKNLLAMYESAQTIDEMLQIEDRLTELNYKINSLTTEIQTMDMNVAYSTITLTISEVSEYTYQSRVYEELPFLERWKDTFVEGFESFVENVQDLTLGLTYNLWNLIVLAIVIVVIVKVRKHHKTKKNKGDKKSKKQTSKDEIQVRSDESRELTAEETMDKILEQDRKNLDKE